jgi:hypothetical protein
LGIMPSMAETSLKIGVVLVLRTPGPTFMRLGSPLVAFDGLFPVRMGWGEEFVSMGPGRHTVECQGQLLRNLKTGIARCEFEVPKDGAIKLRWTAPVLASGRGSWKNLGPCDAS